MATRVGEGWRNRIVRSGMAPVDQIQFSGKNWRIHPKTQQDALSGVLSEVGWVQNVIISERSGNLIDGHARVTVADRNGETEIPAVWVDLSEEEEALVLATIDPLAAMAATDSAQLAELLHEVSTGDAAVQAMLDRLAQDAGVVPPDWEGAFDGLPEGDRDGFQQMTFTLTDAQVVTVKAATQRAKDAGPFDDTGNESGNGNALARICEAYGG